MKLGADRKKVAFLGGLVVVGAYMFYSNVLSGPSGSSEPSRPSTSPVRPAPVAFPATASPEMPAASVARRPGSSSKSNDEFRPSLKAKRPEDRVDPMTIDPTLRLYELNKVQAVEMEGGARNLFQLGQPPPPPLPKEPIVKPKTPVQIAQEEAQKKIDAGPPPPASTAAYQLEVLRIFDHARR